MAEILDNAEITAEILNEISTDLGYPDFKFVEGEKFGNDKLNAITGDLVSKGILFKDDRCRCVLADNKITVNTGVIVFDNGSKKRIAEAVTLDVLEGGTNYVYAKNDTSNGKIYLANSLTEPDGDFVPLCTVTDGVVTDRRVFAKAKLYLFSEGNSYCKEFYLTLGDDNQGQYNGVKSFNITVSDTSKVFFQIDGATVGMYDCQSGLFNYCRINTYDRIETVVDSTDINLQRLQSSSYTRITASKNEEILTVNVHQSANPLFNITMKVFVFDGTESTN